MFAFSNIFYFVTLNIQLSNPKGFNFRNFSFTFFISLDINLGGLTDEDGLMLTQHLLERFPDQKIVILSGYNLPVYRKEAKKIGARGFISKDVEPDELLHILLTIKDGATHFPREEVFIEELTDGERKVLELVASGVRRREIAEQLFILRLPLLFFLLPLPFPAGSLRYMCNLYAGPLCGSCHFPTVPDSV